MKIYANNSLPDTARATVEVLDAKYQESLGDFQIKFDLSNYVYMTIEQLLSLKYEIDAAIHEYDQRIWDATYNSVPSDAESLS